MTSNSSSKAQNRSCTLRSRSSNIIHHLEGRSELRDALTCETGFNINMTDMKVVIDKDELIEFINKKIKEQDFKIVVEGEDVAVIDRDEFEEPKPKIVVKDKSELKMCIAQRIKEQGPNCDLNDIDVSHITDMSYLFCDSTFNGIFSAHT